MTEQKITKLTEKQEARLGEYRDKWLEIGLSTVPTDRELAEKHMKDSYDIVGFKAPNIVWFDSPFAGSLFTRLAEVHDALKQKKKDADKVINLKHYIDNPDKLTKELVEEIKAKLDKLDESELWSTACTNEQNNRMYGMFDAEWLSVYNYFLEVCNLDCCEKLVPLMNVAEQVGWWWPWEEMIIATEKPIALHLDDGNRLHCADGPALEYKDGWSIYKWGGVDVEKRLIEEPETITVKEIEGENNAEKRRILLQIYGVTRYVKDAKLEIVDDDEEYGILYKKEFKDGPPLMCALVTNHTPEPDGTFKQVTLGIPHDANINTAKEAVAWTWDEDPKNFDLVIRS